MMVWVVLALALGLLVVSGDALVRGAVALAYRLGLSPLLVSLTIVGFGTSAPELLIVLSALYEDAPGLAVGNVVGSNIANILLVLGVPAMIATLDTRQCDTRRAFRAMILATCVFVALAFTGPFTWWHGLILLTLLAVILTRQIRSGVSGEPVPPVTMPPWKIAMFLGAGLVGLPLGADLLVQNAVVIAQGFGVSDAVIGLTLVAIGTSLPELATTVMAALRRQADVALGNVIGSNMFNLLGIIGVGSLFGALPVPEAFLRMDLWVMLGAALILVPFVYFGQIMTRLWGVALTAGYGGYLILVLM